MKPNTQELALLRTRPARSELKLWMYKPPTTMAALVNDINITRNATLITFDTVSSGAYTAVQPGQTLYVGTLAGKANVGRVRVKSATATTITVARNNLPWANNLFITAVDFYEIWPMFIRETQQGVNTTHYKDYDIPYAGQNAVMGTLLSIGQHIAVNQGDQVYWSASGTVQTDGLGLTYGWTFGGGTILTGTSSGDPLPVTYNTPGYYTTQVTAYAGVTGTFDTTYRHVIVGGGAVQPYAQFGFDSLDGTRDEGGWVAKIWIKEDIMPEVFEGSLIIVTSEDWYGSTKQSIGGNGVNRQKTLFCGYVVDNSVNYDYINSTAEFHAVSPTGRMKLMDNSSMEIDSVVTPTNWYQIPYLTGKKMMYHYLKWHSTVLNCCDVRWLAADVDMYSVQGEVSNLYDICANLMKKYLIGEMVSDRQGTLWFERHPMGVHIATGTYNTIIDIDRQDWMNEISFDESFVDQTSYLEMGGIIYNGPVTGTWQDVLSGAPGDNLKGSFGKSELIQGQYVDSQAENDQLSGDVLAYKNSTFPAINVELAGWYSIFDIAPQEIVNLSVGQLDTHRGIVWSKRPFLVRDISIDHKVSSYMLLPKLMIHEVLGYEGINGTASLVYPGEPIPIVIPPVSTLPPLPVLPPFDPGWTPLPVPGPIGIPGGTDCGGRDSLWGEVWDPINGPYALYWDKNVLNSGDVATAYFPCTTLSLKATNFPTTVGINGVFEGNAKNNVLLQAFSANINPASTSFIDYYRWQYPFLVGGYGDQIYVSSHMKSTFQPPVPTHIQGFKLTLASGYQQGDIIAEGDAYNWDGSGALPVVAGNHYSIEANATYPVYQDGVTGGPNGGYWWHADWSIPWIESRSGTYGSWKLGWLALAGRTYQIGAESGWVHWILRWESPDQFGKITIKSSTVENLCGVG